MAIDDKQRTSARRMALLALAAGVALSVMAVQDAVSGRGTAVLGAVSAALIVGGIVLLLIARRR
ncbi:hypothetical protein ACFWHF_00805 [Streptomyces griseoincarnatus]